MATSNNTKKKSTTKTSATSNVTKTSAAKKKTKAAGTKTSRTSTKGKTSQYKKQSAKGKNTSAEDMELLYEVGLIILFACMVFLLLCNWGLVGPIGVFFKHIMFGMFGLSAHIMPILLFVGTFFGWVNRGSKAAKRKIIACIVLFLLLGAAGEIAAGRLDDIEIYSMIDFYKNSIQYSNGGGVIGGTLAYFLYHTFDVIGSILILLVSGVICLVLITEKSVVKAVQNISMSLAEKAQNDMVSMRDYAREQAQTKEEARYEQKMMREERRMKRQQQQAEKKEKMQQEQALRKKQENRNRKVSGMDFDSVFTKLGETQEAEADAAEEITVLFPETKTSEDTFELEGTEAEATNPEETIMQSMPDNVTVFRKETKKRTQVTRETAAKMVMETDELHELRPKGSYHAQERMQFVNLESLKLEPKQSEPKQTVIPEPSDMAVSAEMREEIPEPETVFAEDESLKLEPKQQESEQSVFTQSSEHISRQAEDEKQEKIQAEIQETAEEERKLPKAVAAEKTQIAEEKGKEKEAVRVMDRPYQFPPVTLLQKGKPMNLQAGQKQLQETAQKLQECLKTFGVKVTITDISQGPAVTRYELQPEQGVKVSKIVNLSDDIKLNLAATDIRIEAPIPGKSAIGIEVPNKENSSVAFRDLVECEEFQQFSSKISFAVGKDIAGKNVVADIAKMPHMLIAGATGSGKSVCINTLIMSILYKARPDEVKMIMIDPKVVELSAYNGIPHLLIPVVTDPKQAAGALQWGVSEMMARYEKFAEYNVRDMKGFNAKIEEKAAKGEENLPKKLPQIVIIVDELADLMMVAPGEVEEAICRLAQLARAAGIHLIIATQRPSVDVITGLIKANMPSRVAFAVSSGVDSRTILDMNGAEKLLGKGDMLFYPQGYSKPVRIQGSFVSDAEVGAVVDFLKNQQIGNVYQEDIQSQIDQLKSGSAAAQGASGGRSDDKDALFADAGRFIIEKDKASIGMLQRVFKIGFNRAARIVDQLCEYGVVGEEEGTKPRKVLMSLEQFENLLEEI